MVNGDILNRKKKDDDIRKEDQIAWEAQNGKSKVRER